MKKVIPVRDAESEVLEKDAERDVDEETKVGSESEQSGVESPQANGAEGVSGDDLTSRLKAESAENYDKYLRAVAELENFKKRSIKERSDLLRYAGEQLARDLLEVVDTLELAVGKEMPGANEELVKGVRLVLDSFNSILERHSIKSENALGTSFDPQKHEALASVPSDKHAPGTVIEQFKKAYFFKDKLLRPAQVVVSAEAPKAS